MIKRIFGRHHIRANFYHAVAVTFLLSVILWKFHVISDLTSYIISVFLFVVDYLAEMYDPHPENPGRWFKSHFHRFFDDTDD